MLPHSSHRGLQCSFLALLCASASAVRGRHGAFHDPFQAGHVAVEAPVRHAQVHAPGVTTLEAAVASEAVLFLSAAAFIMVVFYIANYQDEDVRYYITRTLELALSTVMALCFFHAVESLVMSIAGGHVTPMWVSAGQYLGWFVALQVVPLWFTAGIKEAEMPLYYEGMPKGIRRSRLERAWGKYTLNVSFLTRALGHLAAFSSYNMFEELLDSSSMSVGGLLSCFVGAFAGTFLLISLVDVLRASCEGRGSTAWRTNEAAWKIAEQCSTAASLTESLVKDAEIDVFVLGLSAFLVGIIGKVSLWWLGPFGKFTALAVVHVLSIAVVLLTVQQRAPRTSSFLALCISWSCIQCGQSLQLCLGFDPHAMVAQVLLALSVSCLSLFGMLVFDMIADASHHCSWIQQAVFCQVQAAAFVIGLSWEECFETAFASIANGLRISSFTVPVLQLLFTLIVAPAIRYYLMPMMETLRHVLLIRDSVVETAEKRMRARLVGQVFMHWGSACKSFDIGSWKVRQICGQWVDVKGRFFGGCTIEITEEAWRPLNPESHEQKKATYRHKIIDHSLHLYEHRQNGDERHFVVDGEAFKIFFDTLVITMPDSQLKWTLRRVEAVPEETSEWREASPTSWGDRSASKEFF